MKKISYMILVFIVFPALTAISSSCAVDSGGATKMSSEPINEKERIAYRRALVTCIKTGGTRIVKIEGNLRCF